MMLETAVFNYDYFYRGGKGMAPMDSLLGLLFY